PWRSMCVMRKLPRLPGSGTQRGRSVTPPVHGGGEAPRWWTRGMPAGPAAPPAPPAPANAWSAADTRPPAKINTRIHENNGEKNNEAHGWGFKTAGLLGRSDARRGNGYSPGSHRFLPGAGMNCRTGES